MSETAPDPPALIRWRLWRGWIRHYARVSTAERGTSLEISHTPGASLGWSCARLSRAALERKMRRVERQELGAGPETEIIVEEGLGE